MKCFTIREEANNGFLIGLDDGEEHDGVAARLIIGRSGPNEGDEESVPISEEQTRAFLRRQKLIINMKAALKNYLTNKGDDEKALQQMRQAMHRENSNILSQLKHYRDRTKDLRDVPDEMIEIVFASIWAQESDESGTLFECGIEEDDEGVSLTPVKRTKHRETRCLVLTHTQAPPGGRLWYEAHVSCQEELVQLRYNAEVQVKRSAFPPAGVRILAASQGPSGEIHQLVLMEKGASFRICRRGNFSGFSDAPGEPPRFSELYVKWAPWKKEQLECGPTHSALRLAEKRRPRRSQRGRVA